MKGTQRLNPAQQGENERWSAVLCVAFIGYALLETEEPSILVGNLGTGQGVQHCRIMH